MALRYLTKTESALAKHVFHDTLPWYHIQVSDRLGFGDRPYTWGRILNVGPYLYQGMDRGDYPTSTLIHELTHVWQYEHRSFSGSYIFDSAAAQAIHGVDAAYAYKAGSSWDSYNAEQQAHIVEDWFKAGKPTGPGSALFPYVRDVIWMKRCDPDKSSWEDSDAATFQQKPGF